MCWNITHIGFLSLNRQIPVISYSFSLKYHYTIINFMMLSWCAVLPLACESRSNSGRCDRKYVCCSQATLPQSFWQQCRKCFAITEGESSTGHYTYLLSSTPFIPWWPKIRDSYSVKMSSTWQKAHLKKEQTQTQGGPMHTQVTGYFWKRRFVLCFIAYRPLVKGVFWHQKCRILKTVSRVEMFENVGFSFTCGRTKTEFKNAMMS